MVRPQTPTILVFYSILFCFTISSSFIVQFHNFSVLYFTLLYLIIFYLFFCSFLYFFYLILLCYSIILFQSHTYMCFIMSANDSFFFLFLRVLYFPIDAVRYIFNSHQLTRHCKWCKRVHVREITSYLMPSADIHLFWG